MLERYFFQLVSIDGVIEDRTGVLADSLGQAEAEALGAIDEFRRGGEMPDPSDQWRLQILNGRGEVLRTLRII